jgi:hypothetical protein
LGGVESSFSAELSNNLPDTFRGIYAHPDDRTQVKALAEKLLRDRLPKPVIVVK